jgi:Cd2+/Zn2+-exporting ATPase
MDLIAPAGPVYQAGTLSGNPVAVAAGIEHGSEHPLARAVLEKARAEGLALRPMQKFEALTGVGATAVSSDGVRWYVGSPALFEDLGIPLDPVREIVQTQQAQGKTVVLVGTNHKLYGLLILQDRVRDGVKDVIGELRRLGLRAVMLTGDNASTARTVAESLGLDDSLADLKPEDKVEAVKELERRHGPVLMVGDGINDAPALAAATCGVAMGVAGSDAAIEAADVALMADDLAKVPEVLRLGRTARRISWENIAFSLLLLAVLIPLAVSGFLSVALVVLIHELSELLAVANGLRVGWRGAVS